MIFTETREGRRFIGEVPPGVPVVATLRTLCANYRIGSGWVDASGLVRDPIVKPLTNEAEFGDPVQHSGVALVASMRVAVSEQAGQTDLVVRVQLVFPDGRSVAGLLVEAESASLELLAQTFDDVTLRRYADPNSGVARWLDVSVNEVPGEPEPVRSGRIAMEAMPSRLLEEQPLPQLRVGDALAHPRLGTCVITQVVDQDRVAIQMESGKIAQLHLGLLTLTRTGSRSGRPLYDVQVRRRG
jgi:predicted DNA-binding protein with PD1-like motif